MQTKFIVDHSMRGSRERRGSRKSNHLVHIVNLPKKASDSPVKHNNPSDPLPSLKILSGSAHAYFI